ncbi:uncharacterized protein LOC118736051 [Rhagoletis pomonella]|uniref:uncharacterized protein LOC118736051 n=1 Tax=Rhagoletis pomonella TaxID=28610 RepID=UPI001786221C|nr:uncharacterized protein LOC118736051 [Rhagoletis pomonella]
MPDGSYCPPEAIDQEINGELKTQLDDSRFAEIEGAYCEALGELEDALYNQAPSPSGTTESVSTKTTMKLPKIELPKFDGTFGTWLSFKDTFSTCVINGVTLSDVQRLHYLKGCLSGDAEVLLRNLLVIDSNFKVAWDILQQRYDNKIRLLRAYLHNIVKLPSASAECSTAIQKLMDGVTESERALTKLGRPTEKWDDWLVYLITEKLDTETLKQWELSLDSPNHIPIYKQLVQFLEKRIVGLEAVLSQCAINPSAAIKPIIYHAPAVQESTY